MDQIRKMKVYDLNPEFSFGSMPLKVQDAENLKRRGFETVISLFPPSNDVRDFLKKTGISYSYLLDEKTPPRNLAQIVRAVIAKQNGKTFVHCKHGNGLSAVIAVAYLVSKGVSCEVAIERVKHANRRFVPNHDEIAFFNKISRSQHQKTFKGTLNSAFARSSKRRRRARRI